VRQIILKIDSVTDNVISHGEYLFISVLYDFMQRVGREAQITFERRNNKIDNRACAAWLSLRAHARPGYRFARIEVSLKMTRK